MKSTKRFLICGVVFIILLLFIKSWYFDVYKPYEVPAEFVRQIEPTLKSKGEIAKNKITLILRYTPDFSTYLYETVNSFLNVFPQLSVLIVSDTYIKKNIIRNTTLLEKQVKIISLKLDLLNPNFMRCVGHYVKTDYILVVPIGVATRSAKTILSLVKLLKSSNASAVSFPVNTRDVVCLNLELNLIQWTIEYKFNHFSNLCDAVRGDHVIFMYAETLQKLPMPFMLPFPESYYIQSTALNMKVKLLDNVSFKLLDSFTLDSNYHMNVQLQRQSMNQKLKIKKIIRETGIVEWYGCTRETYRCFGDIVDSVPDYLNEGRWTPPCCLKTLRETIQHVVKVLKAHNVTFWLEGGSLLGAMRMKDIIPWDYDIDIGMYLNDVGKCPWLKTLESSNRKEDKFAVLDNEGYVWEKARPWEGKFYRVQASTRNRLHVDIFPFYSRKGVMTKETWFSSHPQDREFPEHFLQPLTTIEFAGTEVPAPNNIRDFLELKFGKGCVENPQYPHPEMYPFPPELRRLAVFNESKNYDA